MAEMTDGQLLERFAGGSEGRAAAGLAFATLVCRHGPPVLATCRQWALDGHDADDAFQVTFLVLARKAGSIRQPELLGHWLHGVAVRTARRARALAERRRRHEARGLTIAGERAVGDPGRLDLWLARREEVEALHEEIARLPEPYRSPVVLCDLGGLTHAEAAARLRWPVGTLSVRLMRARRLLRARLTRRGFAPAAGLFLAPAPGPGTAPPGLVEATVQGALRLAEGRARPFDGTSASAAELAAEVLGGLGLGKLAAAALAGGIALIAAVLLAGPGTGGRVPDVARAVQGPERGDVAPAPRDGSGRPPGAIGGPGPAPDASVDPVGAAGPGSGQSEIADGPDAEALGAYRALARWAGRDAGAQVRLALWCEARDLLAERLKHLALAVVIDPAHPAARGLLGQVAHAGRWRSPGDVAALVREDTHLSAALAAYAARRGRMKDNAEGHWKLALWCEQNGLMAEAAAHLGAVTRRAPAHEAAWKRLGCQRHNGRWMSAAQVAAERAEAEAQEEADRYWRPLLARWRKRLDDPRRRDEAERALAEVTDPRALNAVLAVFRTHDRADQARAVSILAQIDSPRSTRALGILTVASPSAHVRRTACEVLSRRDPRDAVGVLAALLRDPEPNPNSIVYRYQVLPIGSLGVGSPGVTSIETRGAHLLRYYTVDEWRDWVRLPFTTVLTRPGYEWRALFQMRNQQLELDAILGRLLVETMAEVAPVRLAIRRVNDRVIQTLSNLTGLSLEGGWQAWKRWWVEEQGYAYDPESDRNPPDLTFFQPKPTIVSQSHFSCFGAGTPVRTLTGPRPIESIRVGDAVLSQDPATGALAFEAVLAVSHNPPAPTLRIDLEGGSIAATGIHRFWVAGRGWVMARDLKAGDPVRTPGGVSRVSAVSADRVQPVFNLEVGEGHSFFAGRAEALVHDNSLVEPVPHPFDEAPVLTAAAIGRER